jgi:hypothetical protein
MGGIPPRFRTDQIYKTDRTNSHLIERLNSGFKNALNDLRQV